MAKKKHYSNTNIFTILKSKLLIQYNTTFYVKKCKNTEFVVWHSI